MKKLVFLLLVLCLPAYAGQSTGGSGTLLNGQPSSYYLNRANHTGTQADSTLNTISTAGKVSGNALTSGTIAGSTAINTSGGIKTTNYLTAESFVGSLEGYSVEVVQVGNAAIVDNDTDILTFSFRPRKIVIDYTMSIRALTTNVLGLNNGHCVVTPNPDGTIGSNLNFSCIYNLSVTAPLNTNNVGNTSFIVRGLGGAGAASELAGSGTWNNTTNALTITYQETSTTTANNFVEMTATAYR